MRTTLPFLFFASTLSLTATDRETGDRDYEEQGKRPAHLRPLPSPAIPPQEALEKFEVAPGFRIELVAAEPLVEDPVAIDFDTKGRLWVVEMRGFMTDLDATAQFEPTGQVKVLTDTDHDGRMDEAVVFAEELVLPRTIRVLPDGALIAEHGKLWFYPDTDNDLVPEERILIDGKYATSGSVEHRSNGMLRGIDNWFYNAKSNKRYRREGDEWITQETESRGQWGICQDDRGRLFYNFNWSQLHADLAPPNTLSRNPNFPSTLAANAAVTSDQRVFPIRMNTAVNRGYRRGVLDEEGKLLEFASACSPWIYRGDLFPPEFRGNAFVCAPGANTVKRNLVAVDGLSVRATNGYPDRDFLASTDERFRPVALAEGPEGGLIVVDMYRGVIQQSEFMTTYLREESEERGLADPIHLGRIYRIVPEGVEPEYEIDFPTESSDWVALLSHPSGWWRDKAQERLVQSKNADLFDLIRDPTLPSDPIALTHALHVLDATGDLDEAFLRIICDGDDAELAGVAIRLLASKFPDASLPEEFGGDPVRDFHLAVALGDRREQIDWLFELATRNTEDPLLREAVLSSLEGIEARFLRLVLDSADWREITPGRHSILQMISSAIGRSGDGVAIENLLGTSEIEWQGEALLDGLVAGLSDRDEPPVLSQPPSTHRDRLASLLAWPGHDPSSAQQADALDAKERARFAAGQVHYANLCSACHGPGGRGLSPLGPPLRNSEWVTGDPDRLAKILLHGLEGPVMVAGKLYEPPAILPAMPPVGALPDSDIAAIMTYVRRAWGHDADQVSSSDVRQVRDLNTDRRTAWTAEELLGSAVSLAP